MNIKGIKNNTLQYGMLGSGVEKRRSILSRIPAFNTVKHSQIKDAEKFDKYIKKTKETRRRNRFSNIKAGFFPNSKEEKKPNIFSKTKKIFKSVKKEFTIHF